MTEKMMIARLGSQPNLTHKHDGDFYVKNVYDFSGEVIL